MIHEKQLEKSSCFFYVQISIAIQIVINNESINKEVPQVKIRSDFVTNSSSSSFILGFKDRDSVAETISNETYLKGDRRALFLLEEIMKHEVSLDECIKEFSEDVRDPLYLDICDDIEGISDYYFMKYDDPRRAAIGAEIEKRIDAKVNQLVEEMTPRFKECGFLSIVEVDDHSDSEMEHDIMPYLSCTLYRISHH